MKRIRLWIAITCISCISLCIGCGRDISNEPVNKTNVEVSQKNYKTIEHFNSGLNDSSERFYCNSEFNNGHSILTLKYEPGCLSSGKNAILQRVFLSTDMFYDDPGEINFHALLSKNGGDAGYYHKNEYTIDDIYNESEKMDGYIKTMKIYLKKENTRADNNYYIDCYISVSPVNEDVRDFLRTNTYKAEEYPSQKDIDESIKICKEMFKSIIVVDSYIGATK